MKHVALRSAVLLFVLATAIKAAPQKAGVEMASAAKAWLDSLSDEQRTQAMRPFDDTQRTHWHYWPKAQRKGVQLRDMTEPQRSLALAVLKAALSDAGYRKATTAMELEAIIDHFEDSPNIRDPLRYFFTVFGTPEVTGRWGLSVEGHHLSLNFLVQDGVIVGATPAFFGANPAEVKDNGGVGPKVGTRTLADEQTLAAKLIASLNDAQGVKATIGEISANADMEEGHKPRTEPVQPRGLPAAEMDERQKQTLRALIEAYVKNMPAEFAEPYLNEIDAAGFDKVHFAWRGSTQPGAAHAYEVRGPTFVILFYNTQPDPSGHPANHVHTVWRTIDRDFTAAQPNVSRR